MIFIFKKKSVAPPLYRRLPKILNLEIHNIYATNQLILFNFFQEIIIIQFCIKFTSSKW
jgi:hypothetical protein